MLSTMLLSETSQGVIGEGKDSVWFGQDHV